MVFGMLLIVALATMVVPSDLVFIDRGTLIEVTNQMKSKQQEQQEAGYLDGGNNDDLALHDRMMCAEKSDFIPCSCSPILTTTKIHDHGKVVLVQFPEYLCNEEINRKRRIDGLFRNRYECLQLRGKRVLYRDVWNRAIKLEIWNRQGCELRCVEAFCPGFTTNNTFAHGGVKNKYNANGYHR